MSRVSLERGRRAEQVIARRLTRWTAERYRFTRRGLGHRSVADLVVTPLTGGAPWPFPISIKAEPRRAPGLHGLCALADAIGRDVQSPRFAAGWVWWVEIPPADRGRYWLIWKAHRTWWLSAAAEHVLWLVGRWPAMLRLAGPGTMLPAATVPLDHVLAQDFLSLSLAWAKLP